MAVRRYTEQDIRDLRRAGLTLPNEPMRAMREARGMGQRLSSSGQLQEDVSSWARRESKFHSTAGRWANRGVPLDGVDPKGRGAAIDMHRRRTAVAGGSGSSFQMAWPKERNPFDYWKERRSWFDPEETDNDESLVNIRSWCRLLYSTHHLVPSLIDIYTRFPLLDIEFHHKDPFLAQFYEELFLGELNYLEHLYDMGREHWITGEVFSLGSWHDGIGAWEAEDIINPSDVLVSRNPILRNRQFHIKVPEELRQLIETKSPREEYQALVRLYPDVVTWARQDRQIPVSDILMKQIKFKSNPWSNHGTPILLRAFRQLMLEEGLHATQDAVADRFYSPFILARLGLDNVDGEPWIPEPDEIDSMRNDLNVALSSDYRLMVYHHGLDIKSVFGREQMPRLDSDFERIDTQVMGVFGIGAELLRGGQSNAPYASGALNRELITQLLETYQIYVKRFMRERMEPIAERQGHYEYRKVGDRRVPVMETVLVYDEDTGEEYVEERPKLAIPEVKFKAMNLRDEKVERQFLSELGRNGWPVSYQSRALNLGIEFADENEKLNDETLEMVVAKQEMLDKLFKRLEAKGLTIPKEYAADYEAWKKGNAVGGEIATDLPTGTTPAGGGPEAPRGNGPKPPAGGEKGGEPPTQFVPDETLTRGDEEAFSGAQPAMPGGGARPPQSGEMMENMPRPASRIAHRSESTLNDEITAELLENIDNAEPAVYGARMKFGSPREMRKRRKMRLPSGIRVATPEDAAMLSGGDIERLLIEADIDEEDNE